MFGVKGTIAAETSWNVTLLTSGNLGNSEQWSEHMTTIWRPSFVREINACIMWWTPITLGAWRSSCLWQVCLMTNRWNLSSLIFTFSNGLWSRWSVAAAWHPVLCVKHRLPNDTTLLELPHEISCFPFRRVVMRLFFNELSNVVCWESWCWRETPHPGWL